MELAGGRVRRDRAVHPGHLARQARGLDRRVQDAARQRTGPQETGDVAPQAGDDPHPDQAREPIQELPAARPRLLRPGPELGRDDLVARRRLRGETDLEVDGAVGQPLAELEQAVLARVHPARDQALVGPLSVKQATGDRHPGCLPDAPRATPSRPPYRNSASKRRTTDGRSSTPPVAASLW